MSNDLCKNPTGPNKLGIEEPSRLRWRGFYQHFFTNANTYLISL
ncbi:Uncharacterised protein [Vibrio cholerae]|nr:Uncharacterised protein [Vibrio cholerae]CSD40292.1 Uncharacterised protein [Vibrio cholerae]